MQTTETILLFFWEHARMILQPRHRFTAKDDRQVAEFVGLARGLTADGHLSDEEISTLHALLKTYPNLETNPLAADIVRHLSASLADARIDEEARLDLFNALKGFSGTTDWEVGEALKPNSLPFCAPLPDITFNTRRFTFTGTFVYGSRKDCEIAVRERNGKTDSSIKLDTSFLVVGEYASDEWTQSSFGRKIEKAVEYRDTRGLPIHIVSEAHWQTFL